MSLFEELKRRNVVRIAVLYAIASWVILQIADVLIENLTAPDWAFRLVLGLLLLGFPLALIFSWVFELTPEGIKREKDIDRSQSITPKTGQRMNRMIIGLLALVIVVMAGERWLLPQLNSDTAATDTPLAAAPQATAASVTTSDRSLAVLPFVNMSGDEENEYFSDGLSEELLNSLARIPELQVTGRTSSFAFKGKNEDLRHIGQQLNVAHVLEGSVRKANGQVRITAQLINTKSGYHLWSDTYDRKLDDIFAIQSDIAKRVATALSVTLLGTAEASLVGETTRAEAYEAYLRGNHILQRNPDDPDTLEQARGFFEQALQYDDNYLQAWYGIFEYWVRRHRNGIGLQNDSMQQMQVIADRLTSIKAESELALLAQGLMQLNQNWPQAVELYRRQMELFPGSTDSLLYTATADLMTNNLKGAINAYERAIQMDPLSVDSLTRLSVAQYMLGECTAVKQTAQRVLELQPDYGRVRGSIAYCLLMHGGDVQEAADLLDQEPIEWMSKTGLAIAHQRLGNPQLAQETMDQMVQNYGDTASYQYAQVLAQWGRLDEAIGWLSKALEVTDPGVLFLCVDPFVAPLREDPRFLELVRKTGFDGCPEPPEIAPLAL